MKKMLIGMAALTVIGCGSSNYGETITITPAESQQRLETQIKDIESNPNMPPQAKAAAISALRRSAEMGKGQATPPK